MGKGRTKGEMNGGAGSGYGVLSSGEGDARDRGQRKNALERQVKKIKKKSFRHSFLFYALSTSLSKTFFLLVANFCCNFRFSSFCLIALSKFALAV